MSLVIRVFPKIALWVFSIIGVFLMLASFILFNTFHK